MVEEILQLAHGLGRRSTKIVRKFKHSLEIKLLEDLPKAFDVLVLYCGREGHGIPISRCNEFVSCDRQGRGHNNGANTSRLTKVRST